MLLNYRRDGTAFWNQVSISPVFDGEGELVNFVGVQNDVTERVIVEQERRAALAEAEEARGYLRLLAEATTEMTAAPDVDGACNRLARIVVPHLADLCAVDLFDRPGEGTARRVAVAARNPADELVGWNSAAGGLQVASFQIENLVLRGSGDEARAITAFAIAVFRSIDRTGPSAA